MTNDKARTAGGGTSRRAEDEPRRERELRDLIERAERRKAGDSPPDATESPNDRIERRMRQGIPKT